MTSTKPKSSPAPAPVQLSVSTPPRRELEVAQAASASAPFIYFEEVPTFGHMAGIVRLALSAARIYPGESAGTVETDRVLVAHLRTNLMGARMLRDALDKALLMANPAETKTRN